MVRDNHNIVPTFMAVLLHVLLVSSMIFAFDFSSRKPPPMPLVIKGTLVADSTIVKPPRVEKPPPPVEKPAPEPEPVVDTAAEERARIAAEEEKRRQDAMIEQQRLEEMRRVQEAEAQRKREEEAQRQREEEARRKREEEAELERRRVEAEQERQREIERQRLENERLRREAEAAVFADAVAEEDARLQAMNSNEMAAYQFALQQKVLRNWARPASARAGLDCLVQVRQSATGEVISANVVSCNGDEATRRSIEAAVYKASPLPLPENAVLFDPNLRFRFIPEQ
jgi:colicin import membrane protein